MKFKQKTDFISNILLLIIGVVLLSLGILKIGNIKVLFISVMVIYAIINFIQYFLTRQSKDYEGLYTSISSIVIALMTLFFYKENSLTIALLLLGWTSIMAIIKFIKTDYYNDRRDRMWKIRIFTLVIFIITGVFSSLSLLVVDNKILLLGYYFFINGVLETIDPITKYLISK